MYNSPFMVFSEPAGSHWGFCGPSSLKFSYGVLVVLARGPKWRTSLLESYRLVPDIEVVMTYRFLNISAEADVNLILSFDWSFQST